MRYNIFMTKTNWQAYRSLFPALKKYTYINAAGGAPLARPVAAAGALYYKEALAYGEAYWDKWLERMEDTRAKLARFINASPREIGFTTNTSHGMSLIAGALGGGAVLTMRDEFPSTTLAWLNAGYKVKFVEPENNGYTPESIARHLTPDIKVLLTSYVQYRTGFRQDLAALGKLCKKRGIIFVVNATQALGAMPLDVKKAQIDFMAFSCFKWTMAGYGAAGIFASQRMLGKVKFPQAGWRSVAAPEKMDNTAGRMKPAAAAVEAGCMHFPSIFALGAALDLLSGIGVDNIQGRIFELNDYLVEGLNKIGAITITPLERTHRSGITVIRTADADAKVEKLAKKGIMVSARGEGIRVSLHFYNNRKDLDLLLAALKNLL